MQRIRSQKASERALEAAHSCDTSQRAATHSVKYEHFALPSKGALDADTRTQTSQLMATDARH